MAKKKKHHTTKRRSPRRRMGATHGAFGNDIMEVVGLVAASVGGTVIQRQMTSLNPKIVSAGEIAVGFYLKNHGTSPFMRGLGWGLLSTGSIGLTHEVGLIHGMEDLVSGMWNGGMIEGTATEHELGQGGIRNNQYVSGIRNNQHIGDMAEGAPNDIAHVFRGQGF